MSITKDTYKSIAGPTEGLFKDNGSRFISYAYPADNEEQIKTIIERLKKEHHDARHHCYAYRLGLTGEKYRANDDGEPSFSAGKPILGQIDSCGLSDTLIVVVRYFGGIKLGIPGLIRAYKTAASDALEKAEQIEKTAMETFRLEFNYDNINNVMTIIKGMGLTTANQEFSTNCSLNTYVRLSKTDDFLSAFSRIPLCKIAKI